MKNFTYEKYASKIWDFIHILFMVVIYLDSKSWIKDEVWGQLFIIYFIVLKTLNFINSFNKNKKHEAQKRIPVES
jgi:hypothetical protein